jgi:hypothetical protein
MSHQPFHISVEILKGHSISVTVFAEEVSLSFF